MSDPSRKHKHSAIFLEDSNVGESANFLEDSNTGGKSSHRRGEAWYEVIVDDEVNIL